MEGHYEVMELLISKKENFTFDKALKEAIRQGSIHLYKKDKDYKTLSEILKKYDIELEAEHKDQESFQFILLQDM
jgi:hypothetical protein